MPLTTTRRALLATAAVTGVAGALPVELLSASDAAATVTAYLPPTRAYVQTKVPDLATRHMADRFAYGYTPALGSEMQRAGGPMAWFHRQLKPGTVADAYADSLLDWFPNLTRTPLEHWTLGLTNNIYNYNVETDHARWTLLRRTYSNRQLYEVMAEFWLNHLHVGLNADLTWLWRQDYNDMIRKHCLGRFDQMLQEAIVHPTMLTFLAGDMSRVIRKADRFGNVTITEDINENLGRELLELHTVGRVTPYTETDVKDSAYILTGWAIDRFKTWDCAYDPQQHYTGEVSVLGFSAANQQMDGRLVLHDYLQYLAHHPATARRIAGKLAVRFVSDNPSDALVTHLADVFLSSGTDIKATIKALVDHPEFAASIGQKVRTPTEDIVSTYRVLGTQVSKPQRTDDAANAIYYQSKSIGQVPFGWGRPDGFPDTAEAWSSAGRMMGSFRIHYGAVGDGGPTPASPTAPSSPGFRRAASGSTCSSTTCAASCTAGAPPASSSVPRVSLPTAGLVT